MFLDRFRTAAAVLILAALLLPGCGRKTALVVPQMLAPAAVNDLRFTLDDRGALLEWKYPDRMVSGEEITAIEGFEVLRAAVPESDYCQGCPVLYSQRYLVDGGPLLSGESRTATFSETDLRAGYRYLYKVRSRTKWYASGDSNTVSFVWSPPPAAPLGLTADAADRKVVLGWQPVTVDIDGKALANSVAYEVYRRRGADGYSPLGTSVREPELVDSGLDNEIRYVYKVRALVASGDSWQPGRFSAETAATPRDDSPPDQPGNLVVIEIPAGMKLAWQAVFNEDLAGYRVYRRREGAAQPELVAEVEPEQNQYVDQGVPGAGIWYYSVSSFDRMQPANESLPSVEASVDLR